MNKPIRAVFVMVAASLVAGATSSSWAATSVGASFVGRNAADILAPSESAGAVPQTNWFNVPDDGTFKGTTASLTDSAGNVTSVKILFDASDSWSSDGPVTTPDEKLMKGIIKANPNPDTAPTGNTDTMTFVITNLPPTGSYNVLVYSMANGTGAEANITLGTTTYYIEQENDFSAVGTFIKASSTTAGVYTDANYAEFDAITPAANGTITIVAKKNIVDPQINDGIGVAGIQIVQVSGPVFGANTTPPTITLQPVSTAVVLGDKASFKVGASGPYSLQWLKNGQPIAGATESYLTGAANSTYAIPSVTATDLGSYSAVVYNNVITNTTAVATLSQDTNPPVVLGATAFPGTTKIGISFNKSLDATTAANAANYQVNGAPVSSAVVRTNVANELTNEKNLVQLTVPTALSAAFTVTVVGVKDSDGHAMASTNVQGTILNLTSTDIGSPAGATPDGIDYGPDPQKTPSQVVNWGPGAFDVLATGANDYWNNADGFNFVWTPKTNSFDVKVRVVSVSPINNWTAGALEVREGPPTTNGGGWELARHYFVKVDYGGGDERVQVLDNSGMGANSYEFNSRQAPGDPDVREAANSGPGQSYGWSGTAGDAAPNPVPFPNAWMRIARVKSGTNDHLLGYASSDGVTWAKVQDVDLNDTTGGVTDVNGEQHGHAGFITRNGTPAGPMPDVLYVGLGSTSHTGVGNKNVMNDGTVGEFWYSKIGDPYSAWIIYRDFGDFGSSVQPGSPTLSFVQNADGTLTLTFTGKLYSSDTVNGGYTAVPAAASPLTVTPKTSGKPATFYIAGP